MRVPDPRANTFAQMTMLRSCFFSPIRSLPPSAAENVLDQLLLQATCRGMQRRLFACGHAKVFRGQCVSHTGRGRLICVAAGTEEVKQLEREVRIGFGQKKRLESSERTDLSSPRFLSWPIFGSTQVARWKAGWKCTAPYRGAPGRGHCPKSYRPEKWQNSSAALFSTAALA